MPHQEDPLRLELLGPMRAWRHDVAVPLGPPKQRAVVGLLATRVNDVVGLDEIVDALWGREIPRTAVNAVHTYIGGLRRALEPGRSRRESGAVLVSTGGGYALNLSPDNIDVTLFLRHHAEARRLVSSANPAAAIASFEAALGLWRGDSCFNVPGPFAEVERVHLRELRLTAVEEWANTLLVVGRHAEAVAALTDAVTKEPLREPLRWLLMLALYQCGRRAQALAVYQETRKMLTEELGVEPGADLRTLHQKILAGQLEAAFPAPVEEAPGPREVLRPAQLPANARGFAGRAAELSRLRNVVGRGPHRPGASTTLVVVDGPPGVGKTALALHLAHELSGLFPDGQLYLDLCGFNARRRPVAPAEALAFLLGSLGVDGARLPPDLAGRTALYRSLLHQRRVLLVFDDAVDAEQLRPLIPSGPACVLVVSRCRQGGLVAREGAYRIGLGPLAPDESAALLRCLVGEARLAGQAADVARLAECCGHLPLALRIAAESLVADGQMSVADLVTRYAPPRGRLDRLTVLGDAAASVRSAFAASYHALPAEAARMFRLLGLYQNAVITVPVAAVLTGLGPADALQQLKELANRHLLRQTAQHEYRFPALLDIYATERAEEEPYASRTAALSRLLSVRRPPTCATATRWLAAAQPSRRC